MSDDDQGERRTFMPLAKNGAGEILAAFESETGDTGLAVMTTKPDVEADGIAVVESTDPEAGTITAMVRPVDGPAKVNSRAYRQGWERIFGKKTAPDEYDA